MFNGKSLKWCGRCGKWTDHDTAHHPGNSEAHTKEGDEVPEGNVATVLNTRTFAGAVCSSLN